MVALELLRVVLYESKKEQLRHEKQGMHSQFAQKHPSRLSVPLYESTTRRSNISLSFSFQIGKRKENKMHPSNNPTTRMVNDIKMILGVGVWKHQSIHFYF